MERSIAQVPSHAAAVGFFDKKGITDLISSLRHGGSRRETGFFFVEGVKMVREALASGAPVEAVVLCPELLLEYDLLGSPPKDLGPVTVEVGRRRYENAARHFAVKQSPQGIGALIRQTWASIDRHVPPVSGIMVALCSVQDAGNVGTILRTCDAVGAVTVFIVGSTADPYGPVAVKASLGAIFGVTPVRTDVSGLARFVSRVRATVVGTSPWAGLSYREAEYKRPVILMLGNEAQGLGDEELGICRQQVSIPMVGRRDSLNVGVAGGIVLYEIFARGSVSWEGVRDVITGQHRGSSGREESGADEV